MTKTSKILMVFTSAATTETGKPAGYYLPEAAHPYYSFVQAGFHVDFASPNGPHPPVSKGSVEDFKDDESVKFLQDPDVTNKFSKCKTLSDVNPSEYDAVFYVGGHGPVIDLSKDPKNAELVSAFWKSDKLVAAVCHGPAALVQGKDSNGESIFEGKRFTGFSNAEEKAYGFPVEEIGFWLEDRITELGGKFESADELLQSHVVVDGKLYTGQNPAAAKPLAERIVKDLKKQ
ncbi:class I glutamine amidotransferase-like protein [Thelephora ganbajun]|uniref:Class I glutamine amidotransferase-like protein n=1 Tax=Thelephora ganbajun TaxID=370292 RepID=A0ACB6ZH03_THEGA|nr:class I glutamine amidotransferase-like protein [Thelephora ganbajun]